MSLQKGQFEQNSDEIQSEDQLKKKKEVRRLLEEKLERKKLKEELADEFDNEDWENLEL